TVVRRVGSPAFGVASALTGDKRDASDQGLLVALRHHVEGRERASPLRGSGHYPRTPWHPRPFVSVDEAVSSPSDACERRSRWLDGRWASGGGRPWIPKAGEPFC